MPPTVPLKFSNLNKGARIADEILTQQANIEVEEARLLVRADVMQAYNNFKYATKQSETFSGAMLNDMQQVVNSKKKAYEMGEIPFLDYLIVQRNENEMRGEYINALFGKAVTWVELQRSIGIEEKRTLRAQAAEQQRQMEAMRSAADMAKVAGAPVDENHLGGRLIEQLEKEG